MRSAGWAAALIALVVAGCGETTTIVRTVTSEAPVATPAAETDAPEAGSTEAELGDTLTLAGDEATLKVRATKIIDPLPVGEYDEPEGGRRFVGIQFSIRNVGPGAYSDAPSNGVTLILRGDEQVRSTIVTAGPCGGNFGSDVKIAAGDKRAGCVPFEVPAGKRLRTFQLTPDSGFADVTAEWDLRNAAPAPAATSTPAASPTAPATPAQPAAPVDSWTQCDANISARAPSTTCGFASNVFYEYWMSGQARTLSAYSPTSGSTYTLACAPAAGQVLCTADDGGAVKFSQAAVAAYSDGQAAAYAASHDVG